MSFEQEEKQNRKMMEDGLAAQNYMTGQYSIFTNQCTTASVKMTFLNLLGEEHRIQNDLQSELHRRGWRQIQPAEQKEISSLRDWAKAQKKNVL